MLTALYPYSKNEYGKSLWVFKCDCGNLTIKLRNSVVSGCTKCCGCKTKEWNRERNVKEEKPGTIYNFLKILEKGPIINQKQYWKCECLLCGKIKNICGIDLRNGNTKSCGCLLSWMEKEIEKFLISKDISYKTQYTFDDLLSDKNRKLRFDFAIFSKDNKLLFLIEYQGEQHYKQTTLDKSEEVYLARCKRDRQKVEYCAKNNIPLLILNKNDNVFKEIEQFYKEV